jgi:hypothetical protein
VSTAVLNAWQGMTDDAQARSERDRLAPGRRPDGEGSRLDQIDVDECWRLIEGVKIGRIGFTAHSGHPLILPVNYEVADGRLLIRSGRGPKLDAARRGDLVAFEVDEIDLALRTGWSVTIAGHARWVRDVRELATVDNATPVPWVAGTRNELIVIEPVHVGGRRLTAPSDGLEG